MNKNVITQTAIGNINVTTTLPVITAKTTLGEVLASLNLGKKPKTPTPRVLFETAGEPLADMNGFCPPVRALTNKCDISNF